MTLSKAVLPSSVEVGGEFYPIKADFRHALVFMERARENAPIAELDFMYVDAIPPDREAGARAIAAWLNPPRELPRDIGGVSGGDRLLDYWLDAELIFAAFWEAYGIDLFDMSLRLHWHKFLALLSGLHDTRLNEVIRARAWRPGKWEGKEYRRDMMRLKEMWRIEPPLTAEDEAAIARFDAAVAASKEKKHG